LSEEQRFRQLVREIPDPGCAVVAERIMRRIRTQSSNALRVRPRDVVWGFAGSVAGIILGLWISSAAPNQTEFSSTEQYSSEFAELQDNIDLFTWELVDDTEDLQ
jgi:hypothetical protein